MFKKIFKRAFYTKETVAAGTVHCGRSKEGHFQSSASTAKEIEVEKPNYTLIYFIVSNSLLIAIALLVFKWL